MRLLPFLFTILGIVNGSMLRSSSAMKWYQVMASRFTIDTIQVDRKCTIWSIVAKDPTHLDITISSHLHSPIGNIATLHFSTNITANDVWISSEQAYDELWMRKSTDNYMMLMGKDNLTFFILSKDPYIFDTNYKDIVITDLNIWDYNAAYKIPEYTFNTTICKL